jgi:hypothetical protein
MASAAVPNMQVPSLQPPFMQLFHHQPDMMTVFGPVLRADLEKTVFASRASHFDENEALCIGVDDSARCKAMDHLNEEVIRECSVIVRPCSEVEIDSDADFESEDADMNGLNDWDGDEDEEAVPQPE